jgi:hypothetical protein
MRTLSNIPIDRGIAIDANLRLLSGFILEHFSAGDKAIETEIRKREKPLDARCAISEYFYCLTSVPLF